MSGGEINHDRNDVAGERGSGAVVRSRAAAIIASRLGGSKRPLIGRADRERRARLLDLQRRSVLS